MAESVKRLTAKAGALLGALVLAACGGGPIAPDRTDPASVAHAFVDAFNAKDLQRMLPLHDSVNIEGIADALEGGPGSEAYERIFVPEMVELLAKEAGNVEGPRYDGREAVVKVASSEMGDVYTVVLEKDKNAEWTIVAHAMMGRQQFEALPDRPKR